MNMIWSPEERKKRVLVAMSGGVDSSVAAYLLKEQGYDCVGVTMKLYQNELVNKSGHTCCSLDDVEDARQVAWRLGIPHHVFNFSDEFEEKVVKHFVESYQQGRTPNPCIDCNRYLKFDRLLHRADELGCDHIATGHYARLSKNGDLVQLEKAVDASRDQSYVLSYTTQEQLQHILFPLGELHKTEVREIAEQQGFCNARKHDSQDICFVPDGDYVGFLERYTGKKAEEGQLLDTKGNVIGKHKGAVSYTIGQRRGLGFAAGERVYVCGKCMEDNTVIIGGDDDLRSSALIAGDWNWIIRPEGESFKAMAKVRYHQPDQEAQVTLLPDGTVRLDFAQPQRAVAPGQIATVYVGDVVLGGGTILKAIK
jgi:tRNA-specific 2-thiouridylase